MLVKKMRTHGDIDIIFTLATINSKSEEILGAEGKIGVAQHFIANIWINIEEKGRMVYMGVVQVCGSSDDIERKLNNFFEALSKKEGFLDD